MKFSPPFILVVLGHCTSGKTTLLDNLRQNESLDVIVEIHDMDERGDVPIPGRKHWRKYRIEELVYDAVNSYQDGISSIIGGWIFPHEIIECENLDTDINLHFLYLKVSSDVFNARAESRIPHRMTADEVAGVIEDFDSTVQQIEGQVLRQKHHFVLDSTKLSTDEVSQETLRIIGELSSKQ